MAEYGDTIPQEIGELREEPVVIDIGTESSGELPTPPETDPPEGFAERILGRILPGKSSGRATDAVKKRAVRLQTLTYDEGTGEYTLTEEGTYFEDLPADAVHVTGKKNRYFRDLVKDPAYSDPTGIRATDLYLWMVNNSINDALAVKKGLGEVDIRRYLVIGIGAIIGVCVIYAMI